MGGALNPPPLVLEGDAHLGGVGGGLGCSRGGGGGGISTPPFC